MKAAPPLVSFRRAAWLLLVLNVADIAITVLAIRAGAHEANPLARFLIETKAIFPLKVLIPTVVIVGAYWRDGADIGELEARRVWFVLGIYCLVIVLNLFTWYHYTH